MQKQWDIVIVGGGLSGLALAAELAAPEFAQLSVLVLEQRIDYTRDRTWSYWTPCTGAQHRYSAFERARWTQWSVALSAHTCLHASKQYFYSTLDADAFYKAALLAIESADHVELRLGCSVTSLHALQSAEEDFPVTQLYAATNKLQNFCINTAHGESIYCRWAFDARPMQAHTPNALVQQFSGWEVHTEYDAFDSSKVQLMVFEPHAKGLHFWYVLPYSPRSALVESTWISQASWKPNYLEELRQYLDFNLQNRPYDVVYREQGVLALNTAPPKTDKSAVRLGRLAGTLRPSTGYAFLDTLAHTKGLADSLLIALRQARAAQAMLEWQPHIFKRPVLDDWMDKVFLDVLSQDWLRAPGYFMQIFERVGADNVIAFLSGRATAVQRIAIMRVLPLAPFAMSALKRSWA